MINRFSVTFALLGIALAWSAFTLGSLLGKALALNVAVSALGVSAAYGGLKGRVFLKRQDGTLNKLSWIVHWPFFLLNAVTLVFYRRFSKEDSFSEIVPGLYLGCRPWESDARKIGIRNVSHVLDVTSELEEVSFLKGNGYLNIPVLDYFPPTSAEFAKGINWIARGVQEEGVYVHCALGHGRSAAFVVAYMVQSGKSRDLEDALSSVSAVRPGVRLSERQKGAVADYLAQARH